MLITPEYVFKDVTHITPEWLAQKGIRALVLDIDNTLVKSLGDGLLAEFDSARQALKAVFDLHDEMSQISQGLGNEQAMRLRAGIHSGEVFLGEADIYGANVNIAARLASLAAPGETVASATVRDCITDGFTVRVR